MHNFELRCNKIKAEKPNVEVSAIEEVVKEELIRSFDAITPKAGRALLKDAGILILLQWDTDNAMIFDAVRREGQTKYSIEEEVHHAHKGVKFSEDHKALVLWSLQDKDSFKTQENSNKAGSFMIYRVGETSGEQAALMTKQVGDFNL